MTNLFGLSGLVAILSWRDIAPFRGQMIVYTSDSSYFHSPLLGGKASVGMVSSELTTNWSGSNPNGYSLYRLVPLGSVHGNCALIDYKLEMKNGVRARLATENEKEYVFLMVQNKRAEWDVPITRKIEPPFKIWKGTTLCNYFRQDDGHYFEVVFRNLEGKFWSDTSAEPLAKNSTTLDEWNKLPEKTPVSIIVDEMFDLISGSVVDVRSYQT